MRAALTSADTARPVRPVRAAARDTLGVGLPAALGVAATAALHLWRRNALLSIVVGTGVCMLAGRLF